MPRSLVNGIIDSYLIGKQALELKDKQEERHPR